MIRYLKWLNSVRRRALDDLKMDLMRQSWQARGVTLDPHALVLLDENASLQIGQQTVVGPYTVLHLQNDPLLPETEACRLTIGRRTAINEFCNIRASGGEITIGDDCLLSQFVSIIAVNHSTARGVLMRAQRWDNTRRNVVVGNDVWIGANTVILPGTTIGNGSVVAAGAVVTRAVPENAIVAGVPARVIGERA